MPNFDEYELEVLNAFEKEQLKSVATKPEIAKFEDAARVTIAANSSMVNRCQ